MSRRKTWTKTQFLRSISLILFLGPTAFGVIRHRLNEAAGLPSPDEIKGWRTLQEVVDIWQLPADLLYRETGLSPEQVPLTTPLKDLEALTAGTALVVDRTYVADLMPDTGPERSSKETRPGTPVRALVS